MNRNLRSCLAVGMLALAPLSVASAQQKVPVPPAGTVNLNITTAATAPPVSITLYERHGHVTPNKGVCAHTGGGLIDVASPTADVVIITMSGAVVANAEMHFDLEQCFEVSFDDPKVKKAKLTVEGRVIGLLRGEPKGSADFTDACGHITCGPAPLVSLCVPPHSVADCQSLAVNDHDGPRTVPVLAGKYTLNQTFAIAAHTSSYIHKRPSAEFAPDPALDPLWITYFDPFHGVKKDTFGFQITLKVAADTDEPPAEKKDSDPKK